jgi:hypothetical protein
MAADDHVAHEPAEAWMAPIEATFVGLGANIVRDFVRDAEALIGGDGLVKALPAPAGLDAWQIADLKALIRQHYTCHLVPDFRNAFWRIPESDVWRWRAAGVLGPTGAWALTGPISDVATAARLAAILDTGASYETMMRLAAERPASAVANLARQFALDRLFVTLDGLAWRHADLVARMAIEQRQRAVSQMIADYLGGTLVVHDRQVRGTGMLASALRGRMMGQDIARDWQRVAVTETRLAYKYGSLAHYVEQMVRRVYFRVHPDACADCKRLLLRPDGTPIVFDLADLLAEVAEGGGTNVGRPRALWRPTLVIHPWCRCSPVPFDERTPPPLANARSSV